MDSDGEQSRPVRDYLKDWPYTPQYLQATLDPELIADHGRAILLRALNTRRMVCFVGSGVSMIYGRLGWSDLVRELDQEANDARYADLMSEKIKGWLSTLKINERSAGDYFHSGRYPTAFQFCEQLAQFAVDEDRGLLSDRDEVDGEAADSPARAKIRSLLFDDWGHACLLLKDALVDEQIASHPIADSREEKLWSATAKAAAEAALGGIPSSTRKAVDSKGTDEINDAKKIPKDLHKVWRSKFRIPFDAINTQRFASHDFAADLINELTKAKRQPNTDHLCTTPLLRFVSTALARLDRDLLDTIETRPNADVASASPIPLRSADIPTDQDPLRLLVQNLRINRFITTNYDLDLERLLRDRGFRLEADSKKESGAMRPLISRDTLGIRSKDGLFDPDHPAQLFNFALDEQPQGLSVMHLHGRATSGDPMVVTDQDYMRVYLQRGDDADVIADSIALAFSANPILFIGSGMSEDDILRPLRQFVAERKSREDRQAIALLPASGTKAREVEEVISIYSRYGVHTMHFGIGCIGGLGNSRAKPVRWLACFLELIRVSKDILGIAKDVLRSIRTVADGFADIHRIAQSFELERYAGVGKAAGIYEADEKGNAWSRLILPRVVDRDAYDPDGTATASDNAMGVIELAVLNGLLHFVWSILQANRFGESPRFDGPAAWFGAARRESAVGTAYDFEHDFEGQRCKRLRVVLMYLAIVDGLPGALTGLALNAKLRAIDRRMATWKDGRRRLPSFRRPGGPMSDIVPQWPRDESGRSLHDFKGGRLLLRHPLALRPSPVPNERSPDERAGTDRPDPAVEHDVVGKERAAVPPTDRFFSDAPSQTFQAWLGSMQKDLYEAPKALFSSRQRRLLVLYADRGIGKGHFFEALHTERRLGEFVAWSRSSTAPIVEYDAFAYFNLSFSLEVVSVFDRIADLLQTQSVRVFKGETEILQDIAMASEALQRNRVARLRALLERYHLHGAKAARRLLLAISPFNMLFDERGDPKNAELHRLIGALLDEAFAKAPIDLILLCSGRPFPRRFQKPTSGSPVLLNADLDRWTRKERPIAFRHLTKRDISAKGHRRLTDTVTRLNVNLNPDSRQAYFHVLREAKTSNTIMKYFPEVAIALAAEPGRLVHGEEPILATRRRLEGPHASQRLRNQILAHSDVYKRASGMVAAMHPLVTKFVRGRYGAVESGIDDFELPAEPADVVVLPNPPTRHEWHFDRSVMQALDVTTPDPPTRSEVDAIVGSDADYRLIFRSLERNRFLVTIACAVAAEEAQVRMSSSITSIDTGAVVRWWRRLLRHLNSLQAVDRADQVIDHVLECYQDRHERGESLPIDLDSDRKRYPQKTAAMATTLEGPAGWELQQQLLWHLAVVGHPVEADVLAASKAIRENGLSLLRRVGSPPSDVRRLLDYLLDVLVRRCLVFRLHPAKVGDAASQPQGPHAVYWRYTVHRFIQRDIFRKLHAPNVEHASIDPYGLSMWITQPDDLPRPNRTTATLIADLLADWTGFPKDVHRIMRPSVYHAAQNVAAATRGADAESMRVRTLPSRLLRASLGVVRTVYSVGVLSRFHEFANSTGQRNADEGFFRQYRLQIRWLIEKARELGAMESEKVEVVRQNEEYAPFFAEEVVWLYNECGLFSLIEGRLDSAAGLFAIALRAAGELEAGEQHGALWCRIHMNLAVVDIERGRLREARQHLEAIRSVEDENPILRIMAHGYLGLIDHYNGNSVVGREKLESVVKDLEHYGQSRAIAIFSRHIAEILRSQEPKSAVEAQRAIDRAVAAAMRGGHEDVRQMAELTRVRMLVDGVIPVASDTPSIQQRLDEIETYGINLAIPRLAADASYARASHLLSIGETRYAASLAIKCLRIAKSHNLKLRMITAITLLAKIYERRGIESLAVPLRVQASELAESCDYSSGRDRARYGQTG